MQGYTPTPDFYNDYIAHHGILGMKWGKKNGPPYPLGSGISTGHRLKNTGSVKKKVTKTSGVQKAKRKTSNGSSSKTEAGRKIAITSKDGKFNISKEVMDEFIKGPYDNQDLGKAIIMMKEDNPNFSSMYNGVKSEKDINTRAWFISTKDGKRYALYAPNGKKGRIDKNRVTFESLGTSNIAYQKKVGYTFEDAKRWEEIKVNDKNLKVK